MVRKIQKEYLFVDGYNVINSWDRFNEIKNESFEEARNQLIDILVEYMHYSKIEIILVFDGHQVKGNNGTKITYKGLEIIYTKENETADQYIEKQVDEIGRNKKVRVATSDWIEQQIILARGATRISSRELEVEIFNERKTIDRKINLENKKNDLLIGRLDEETINKLNKFSAKKK